MAWLTRGVRQSRVDVWTTRRKPVLVHGNWRHPSAPGEPKRFWMPWRTIPLDIAQNMSHGTGFADVRIQPGECVQCRLK